MCQSDKATVKSDTFIQPQTPSHQSDNSEGWRMTGYQYFVSPTGGGQPREDEARPPATTAIKS